MPLDLSKIKARRESLNLTMREAAELAGLSSAQGWNAYESGAREPSVSAAEKIAGALRTKLQSILVGNKK